jgi:hypothetical protein
MQGKLWPALPILLHRSNIKSSTHCPSPNLSLIKASKASEACCSCSPSVSSTTSAPAGGQHHHAHDAFGVDAALAAREPDFAGKLPASLVSLADARACRPNLLLMVTVV